MIRILVLGAAAGGGFPQWNCNCANCRRAWDEPGRARTQASLAVSAGAGEWFLLNASPDLRQQIIRNPALHPADGPRGSPIAGVVLTGADVDQVAGLLTLRESEPFALYATRRIHEALDDNAIFRVLRPDSVARRVFEPGRALPLAGEGGRTSGLEVEAFVVPGKVALYLEDPGAGPGFGTRAGDTVGLKVSDVAGGASFFFIPSCAEIGADLKQRLAGARLVFFDGTLWRDDEMVAAGLGAKTGRRMGHVAIAEPDGPLAAFAGLGIERKLFIHINNTNPVWFEDAPERATAEAAGWTVAEDGMELVL